MDRRHILAGLAAAVAATPALAQTMQPAPAGSTPAPGARAGSMPDGAHQMGQAEMKHMQDTLMAGMVALETSNVALEKARGAEVKQFAKFEKAEQEGIADVLKSMMDPAGTASTPGQPPMPMPMRLEGEKAQMVQKMKDMQAGANFDKEYIQGQIQGHQELLRIQETYLQNGRNREHINVAKLARGHIKEHIEELQDIEKKLRG